MRGLIASAVMSALGSGCTKPIYALAEISDPLGVALGADAVTIAAFQGAVHRIPLDGRRFPLTVTLEAEVAQAAEAQAQAFRGERVIARAFAELAFDGSTTPFLLAAACSEEAECDDGTFCNGAETCVRGACAAGRPPCESPDRGCLRVECSESARLCHASSATVSECRRIVCGEMGFTSVADPTQEGVPCGGAAGVRTLCLGGECVESRCGDGFRDEVLGEDCDGEFNCGDCRLVPAVVPLVLPCCKAPQLSADGRVLAGVIEDGVSIVRFDVASESRTVRVVSETVSELSLSPSGKSVWYASGPLLFEWTEDGVRGSEPLMLGVDQCLTEQSFVQTRGLAGFDGFAATVIVGDCHVPGADVRHVDVIVVERTHPTAMFARLGEATRLVSCAGPSEAISCYFGGSYTFYRGGPSRGFFLPLTVTFEPFGVIGWDTRTVTFPDELETWQIRDFAGWDTRRRVAGVGFHLSSSGDGRHIAYAAGGEVFVTDVERSITQRVSVTREGTDSDGPSDYPTLSADAKWIAFPTDAPNLLNGSPAGSVYLVPIRWPAECVIYSDTCPQGQHCDVDPQSGGTACLAVAPNAAALGAACQPGGCQRGGACLDVGSGAVCYTPCEPSSGTGCAQTEACSEVQGPSGPLSFGICQESSTCTPVNDTCPKSQMCAPISQTAFRCAAAGTRNTGETCGGTHA